MVQDDAAAARPGLLGQLVRFAVVGGFSAIVDLSVYSLGLHLGLSTYVARALSFIAGTTTAYALNRRWAFQVEGGARRAGGFALLYGTTFFLILASTRSRSPCCRSPRGGSPWPGRSRRGWARRGTS